MGKSHRLDLLSNSISYFKESVRCAQNDLQDTDQWKFAIIHVVQAMELAFKEYLRRIHPVFIYESIDGKMDKTINLKVALMRLRHERIGNISISENERSKLEKAFDLRNSLTHFEFDHDHEHIELKFAEIFSFMIFFYRIHLGISTGDFIDNESHSTIINLVKTRAELLEKARTYISSNGYSAWACPTCGETTFVVEDTQCCFCHHKEEVSECEACGEDCLDSDILDITDLWEWDYDEGRMVALTNYGLPETACINCVDSIKDKIEEEKRAQYYEDMARDEWFHRK